MMSLEEVWCKAQNHQNLHTTHVDARLPYGQLATAGQPDIWVMYLACKFGFAHYALWDACTLDLDPSTC